MSTLTEPTHDCNHNIMMTYTKHIPKHKAYVDTCGPHPLEILEPSRYDRKKREKSFKKYPKSKQFVNKEDLIDDGFVYIGDGKDDKVKCTFCGKVLSGFYSNDDVHIEHVKHSPQCRRFDQCDGDVLSKLHFERQRKRSASPVCCGSAAPDCAILPEVNGIIDLEMDGGSDSEHEGRGRMVMDSREMSPEEFNQQVESNIHWPDREHKCKLLSDFNLPEKPRHKYYAWEKDRLDTFSKKGWPKGHPKNPEDLARAGFYYTGEEDTTACYYCGRTLNSWEPEDDIDREHYRFAPHCPLAQYYAKAHD